jgi:uracil-DNA glycosylase
MEFIVQILNFSFTFPNYLLHNVLIVQSRKGLLHLFDTFAYHLISIISNHLIKKKKEKKIKRRARFVFLGKCVYLCGALFDKCGIIRKRFAMQVKIEESWRQQLQPQFDSAYFEILTNFVRRAYQTTTCYPPGRFIFEAFNRTPFDKVKVVILGQDPYHEPGQAHGLCFSVQPGIALPPSLLNIYKELVNEFGQPPMVMPGADPRSVGRATALPNSGDLSAWADQGVLLLNATLTVRAHQAGSHQRHGWETFTDCAIQRLSEQREGLVFLLWGNYAIEKQRLIDTTKHYILTAPHPSPLSASRGFFGCHHFSKTNEILVSLGKEPVNWQL